MQPTSRPRRPSLHRSRSLLAVLGLIAGVLAVATTPAAAGGHVVVPEGASIQEAIDAAAPGTRITVQGDHVENLWISTDGISLIGRNATLTMPENPTPAPEPCQPEPGVAALICVLPVGTTFAEVPTTRINGVTISGFTLDNPSYDAINMGFVDDVDVNGNTIRSPGCDGVFVIFASDVIINRNTVTDAGCAGINLSAARDARVQRNTTDGSVFNGIAINDVTHVVVHQNSASGNCIGIGVVDGADGGYGVQAEDFPGDVARISGNTTNGNNRTCPFGPGLLIGGTGIIVGGVDFATVKGNTANGNVVVEESLTAGGIVVTDFPNQDGSFNVGDHVRVENNNAAGNSSPAGPQDLVITSGGTQIRIFGNSCGVGVPDPSICR